MSDLTGDQDPSALMRAATVQVRKLTKAVERYRRFQILLSAVTVLVIVACIAMGYLVVQVNNEDRTLRQQSIAQCEGGNTYRSGDEAIWHKLFAISYSAVKPSAEELKLDNEFLAYVYQVDKLRNCQQTFSPAARP